MAKKKIDYSGWSKDDLVKEITRIKETTYGLVWHRDVPQEKIDILINPDARTPEEMFKNEVAGKPFPVLKEVVSKKIVTAKDKPTNILIEGDNYHSLAVLNFTHQEKVNFIYIDPPYNTGNNDFIYNDSYVDKEDSFKHSKWLSFMERRLKLAKNLLRKDGVIFISIDDNEQAPLKMLCDEIFGQENFISTIIWQKKYSPQNDAKYFSNMHDFVLVYAKAKNYGQENNGWNINLLERTDEQNARYSNPDNDSRGVWKSSDLLVKTYSAKYDYEIVTPFGRKVLPPKGRCWRVSREKYDEMVLDNRIWFGQKGDAIPSIKRFLSEVQQGIVPSTIWFRDEVGDNQEASEEIKNILGFIALDNPKPTRLIQRMLQLGTDKNATVLDFFAGSGTTGQAVLEQNKLDGGARKFILCTNNGDEKSEHKIATDICYPRIKKVIGGYKNLKGLSIEGIGGNLRYFTAYDFVESEPTDKNKRKLVKKSSEMLCIKEGVYDLVKETEEYKIFKNSQDKYLGVIFYEDAISEYKKELKKINHQVHTYVFSLGDDPYRAEFEDVKGKVILHPIPEVILRVYKEIFK